LFHLTTILPEEQKPALIKEALETARQVRDTNRRMIALLTLIEALPEDIHPDIIHESMKVIAK